VYKKPTLKTACNKGAGHGQSKPTLPASCLCFDLHRVYRPVDISGNTDRNDSAIFNRAVPETSVHEQAFAPPKTANPFPCLQGISNGLVTEDLAQGRYR